MVTDGVAAAAIDYEPEGFDIGRERLMGRHAAGAGFLAGYARHGRTDPLFCFTNSEALTHRFAEQVGAALGSAATPRPRNVRWLPRDRPEMLAEIGCLYYPGPVLAPVAWQRRYVDQRAYSLCGITHTTASDTVMEAIGSFLTAPLQSWDAVICTSQSVRRTVDYVLGEWAAYLGERLGAPAPTAPLQQPVIPLGVDCASFDTDPAVGHALRVKLGIADDAVVAMFLGRLTAAGKAHPLPMFRGLEAAARRTGRRVHLMMVGWFANEAEERAFQTLAAAFAPSLTLHLLDGRDATVRRDAWAAADLFTSLSDNIQETFGLTPVEAMAAGKPVVISDWNGYRETMQDGVQGYMVPTVAIPAGAGRDMARRYRAGQDAYSAYIARTAQFAATDPVAAADAYTRLVGDPGLRRQMGEAGRRHVRANFDWGTIIPRYEALWAELGARRAADTESAPPWPERAADPLRDDPALLFGHYPTRMLADRDRVVVCEDAPDFTAVTGQPINVVAHRLMLDQGEIGALRSAIVAGADRAPATVAALIGTLPAERRDAARRTLVWLQKMGFVRLVADG